MRKKETKINTVRKKKGKPAAGFSSVLLPQTPQGELLRAQGSPGTPLPAPHRCRAGLAPVPQERGAGGRGVPLNKHGAQLTSSSINR